MSHKYLLLLIVSLIMVSCKKEKKAIIHEIPGPEIPGVLVKDITIPHLPSPYYHFEYDTTGRVSFVSFASGFTMYDVVYDGDRVSEMKNNIVVNKDRLQYSYDNAGRVSVINYADSAGIVYKKVYFTYNGQKLIKLEREQKSGPDFIVEKTMTFTYYADGNLRELAELRPSVPVTGQSNTNYVDRFEQYDNKINAEGFSLIHNEFFDHLVLLPAVQLQKNNPGRLIHTGDDIDYRIDYTYTYNDKNAPLTKSGTGVWLSGSNAGRPFRSDAVYSYY